MPAIILAVAQKAANERLDATPPAANESAGGATLQATFQPCSLVIVAGTPARLVVRLLFAKGSFTAGDREYGLGGCVAAFRVAVRTRAEQFPDIPMDALRTRDDLEPSQSKLPDFGADLPAFQSLFDGFLKKIEPLVLPLVTVPKGGDLHAIATFNPNDPARSMLTFAGAAGFRDLLAPADAGSDGVIAVPFRALLEEHLLPRAAAVAELPQFVKWKTSGARVEIRKEYDPFLARNLFIEEGRTAEATPERARPRLTVHFVWADTWEWGPGFLSTPVGFTVAKLTVDVVAGINGVIRFDARCNPTLNPQYGVPGTLYLDARGHPDANARAWAEALLGKDLAEPSNRQRLRFPKHFHADGTPVEPIPAVPLPGSELGLYEIKKPRLVKLAGEPHVAFDVNYERREK